jgi:methyl-accepting chemotaxis protein WspA
MDKINQLKLSAKLLILTLVALSGLTLFAAVAFDTLDAVRVHGALYQRIADDSALIADVLPPPLYAIEAYLTAHELAVVKDKREAGMLIERARRLRREYDERHGHWASQLPSGALRAALLTDAHAPAAELFDIIEQELIPLAAAHDGVLAAELVAGPIKRAYGKHRAIIDRVVKLAQEAQAEEESAAQALVEVRRNEMLAVACAVGLLVVLLAWFTVHSVTKRIAIGVHAAEKVANGDLTDRIDADADDETGTLLRALKRMTQSLSSLIYRVKQSSVSLMSTATEISATSMQQEATVNNLSSSTAEIAAAVKEISATSQELGSTLQEINLAAVRASSLAERGRVGLSEMDATMRRLSGSTGSISTKLSVIREKASDINGVVTTITKVADQTNLLSVNAAIEAEKAGEYGLGFLVVAREIRRLADQSAVATLDIEQMVRHMHAAVSAGVMEMDKFADEVRGSVSTVADINGQLGEIIEEVQRLGGRIESVSEGMSSQAQGAAQISEAMSRLTESARQTASSVKEFNSATHSLREAVSGLKEEISSFTVAS